MASLVGMDLDNVLMKLDGPETPIMDGSAIQFLDALESAGIQIQEKDREYFQIPHNIAYTEPDRKVEIVAMPLDDYRFTCMIDYNSPVLGSQHAGITSIAEFKKEIASCRTFCFLHELEYQLQNNLIKGGDLNNAIVIVDKEVTKEELDHLAKIFKRKAIEVAPQGILNNMELRHQNEPARHKLLDMNGIEDNEFSAKWVEMGRNIPEPKAVVVVSAHWFTRGTQVTAMDFPKTIHDFGGFPQALFDVEYPAPGDPELAKETAGLIHSTAVGLDHDWGLDHVGTGLFCNVTCRSCLITEFGKQLFCCFQDIGLLVYLFHLKICADKINQSID